VTTAARQALADAATALDDFEASASTPYWRTRWVALVALLRAVGHVLSSVDSDRDARTKDAIDSAWNQLRRSRPEPRIFWDFIQDERNNVLKAYRFGAGLNITVRPGSAWYNLATGESGGTEPGPTTYEAFMRAGTFEGELPSDVARQALTFWTRYLDEIDRAAVAGAD
jgi:hypothetical protein